MRIAVDAMGSDAFPVPDVQGALEAIDEYPDIEIVLIGDEKLIRAELESSGTKHTPEIVHTSDYVSMTDKPGQVIRSKPDASMGLGMRMVKEGKVDAFVTAGNTGAALAYALLKEFKRIPNVLRPAFPTLIPALGKPFILVDSGANADCRPEWLFQFAIMGSVYAESVFGINSPTVGLLSNGEEEGKGNKLTQETMPLLTQSSLNFIGYIEPRDAMFRKADVIVADGFTGNLFLKALEATGSLITTTLRQEVTSDLRSKLGALLLYPAFKRLQQYVDPSEIGGAPLLGVNGLVVVGHGSTNAKGVKSAIREARKAVSANLIALIQEQLVEKLAESNGS